MRQQTTALVFSVLLLSTLAHIPYEKPSEARHHNRVHHNDKHQHQHQHRHLQPFARSIEKTNNTEPCPCQCDPDQSVRVIVNVDGKIIAITNGSVGLIFDVANGKIAAIDIAAVKIVIYDINLHKGYIISDNSTQSFEEHTKKSLEALWKLGQEKGRSFDKNTTDDSVKQVIISVLIQISAEYTSSNDLSASASVEVLVKVAGRLSAAINSPSLKDFFSLVVSVNVIFYGKLERLLGIFEGLAFFFGKIEGGLGILKNNSSKLDLKLILPTRNSVELLNVLVVLLLENHVDVKVLVGLFSSVKELLSLIGKLGGDDSVGVDFILKAIFHILGIIDGSGSVQAFIKILIEFAAKPPKGVSLKEEYEAAIKQILQIIKKINSSGLENTISFLENLLKGELTVKNVSISKIVKLFFEASVNAPGLIFIVKALVELQTAISIRVLIFELLIQLVITIDTIVGFRLVLLLIPELSAFLEVLKSTKVNILKKLLEGVRDDVFKLILKGDFSGIKVIATIVTAIAKALKAVNFDFWILIKFPDVSPLLLRLVVVVTALSHGKPLPNEGSNYTTNQTSSVYVNGASSDGSNIEGSSGGSNNGNGGDSSGTGSNSGNGNPGSGNGGSYNGNAGPSGASSSVSVQVGSNGNSTGNSTDGSSLATSGQGSVAENENGSGGSAGGTINGPTYGNWDVNLIPGNVGPVGVHEGTEFSGGDSTVSGNSNTGYLGSAGGSVGISNLGGNKHDNQDRNFSNKWNEHPSKDHKEKEHYKSKSHFHAKQHAQEKQNKA